MQALIDQSTWKWTIDGNCLLLFHILMCALAQIIIHINYDFLYKQLKCLRMMNQKEKLAVKMFWLKSYWSRVASQPSQHPAPINWVRYYLTINGSIYLMLLLFILRIIVSFLLWVVDFFCFVALLVRLSFINFWGFESFFSWWGHSLST